MQSIKQPAPFKDTKDSSTDWKRWKQRFVFYMQASGASTQPEAVKCALLIHCLGEDVLDIYNGLPEATRNANNYDVLLDGFENYFAPLANITVSRHKFHSCVRNHGETVDEFITNLKVLAGDCDFGNNKDEWIRDRIVYGINDVKVQERLLREQNLTLQRAIAIARAAEAANLHMKTLNSEEVTVNALKKLNVKANKSKKFKWKQKSKDVKLQDQGKRVCGRCGQNHKFKQCPAWNKECKKCNRMNHFAEMCKVSRKQTEVNCMQTLSENESESGEDVFYLGSIENPTEKNKTNWFVRMKILDHDKEVAIKADSGAQTDVLPKYYFERLGIDTQLIKPSKAVLVSYSGDRLKVFGQITLKVLVNGIIKIVTFQVVETKNYYPCLLGLPSLINFKLIKEIDLVENNEPNEDETDFKKKFPGVFSNSLKTIKDQEYVIRLKPQAEPTIEPCRKLPIALMKPLKSELMKLEKLKIICKVTEPTDWVSSLVLAKKDDGSLRLCLDTSSLNKSIKREHFQLPTFEMVSAKMGKSKIFSKIDASKAFWQIKLSKESCKYTTFNTPFGRYYFLRMPYGIISSSEVFQRIFMEIFGDIPGCEIYVDDLIIHSESKEEHDKILNKVFEKAEEHNVTFNYAKCKFYKSDVLYLGHKFTSEGILPDDTKLETIVNMKSPSCTKELETFLGMITYISRFIPNVSERTNILRGLLKKNSMWEWTSNHEKCFQELKKLLISPPVLRYFDVTKDVVVTADASQNGIGCALLQEKLPVAYGSCALNETQKRWAQIEKELYAIVFACEKFYQFLYGKHVVVESDHKPLEAIMKKPLNKCPPRLQRMLMRLQKFDLEVRYKPGKELLIADCLSRNFLPIDSDLELSEQEIETHVSTLIELPMSES